MARPGIPSQDLEDSAKPPFGSQKFNFGAIIVDERFEWPGLELLSKTWKTRRGFLSGAKKLTFGQSSIAQDLGGQAMNSVPKLGRLGEALFKILEN